jgi:acyl-coenzyme A synthetase/AMP-(fatty) acid ligase
MGDVGYLDSDDRFWFCGRKSHRVISEHGTLFTIPCETIFNQHPWIYRSALVGAGPRGSQKPVIFLEVWPEHRVKAHRHAEQLHKEVQQLALAHKHTREIKHFYLVADSLPVDIRHNAKIFREELVPMAETVVRPLD